MTRQYDIKLTLGYGGTDFERKLTLSDVDSVSAATETVRGKVKAINASLEAGTDDGLSDFFRSDDYNASEAVGDLSEIKECVIERNDTTVLI